MVNVIELSLMEQMRISERDILQRKALFGLADEDADMLASCRDTILRNLDSIVDEFYAVQGNISSAALLIGDRETLSRLKQAQRHYIVDMFSGVYDESYINSRLRVGKIHKRIGVTPMLYMSAVRLLTDLLAQHLERHLDPKVPQDKVRSALLKLMMFDVALIFDTYIASMMREVDSARRDAEVYAANLAEQVADRTRQLEEMSRRDSLTGLFNQRALFDLLRHHIATAERSKTPLAVAYMDLNGFKRLNDTKGHATGDVILQRVATSMLSVFRDSDVCARCGGDEFCAIMPNASMEQAEQACRRLIEESEKADLKGVSISIGISAMQVGQLMSGEELLKLADDAMYQAKELAHKTPTLRGNPSNQLCRALA